MTDQTFTNKLLAIASDRTSGAAELARKCLEIVAESSLQDNSNSTPELLQKLKHQADLLARSRPSIVSVANLLHIFQEEAEKFRFLPLLEARNKSADFARKTIELSIKSTERTAKNTAALIGKNKTVFTHSYSSTVIKSFALLDKKGLKVIISESRPLCEGNRLAEKLSQLDIPTTLITDAQTGIFVKEADIVLSLGCGIGVQAIAEQYPEVWVVPGLNTTFMGLPTEQGVWEERCAACGDCLLGLTGGICPIARCSKSLLNGPCGGSEAGHCEIDPDVPCAWQLIYDRMVSKDKLHLLLELQPPKNWRTSRDGGPRKIVREDLRLHAENSE